MRKPPKKKPKTKNKTNTSKEDREVVRSLQITEPDASAPPNHLSSLQSWIYRRWQTVFLIISLLANLYQLFGGPPWPVPPEIHPTSDGSSLIHPFTIKNHSGLFDMPDVRLSCGVNLLFARDATGSLIFFGDIAAETGTASFVAGETKPYQCDTSKLFTNNADGTLSFNYSNTNFKHSNRIKLPLDILKTCVWIGGEYRLFGFKINFTSKIFQWPDIYGSESHQWAEGEPIGYRPTAEIEAEKQMGLIPGALRCSPKVDFLYALATEDGGRMLLVFPPDPMGNLGAIPPAPTL